ncbi:MAG: hypothetical protein ACP5PT_06850 [Brevinematia bacterium]|jgi:DNA-binding response OmpR family regulator
MKILLVSDVFLNISKLSLSLKNKGFDTLVLKYDESLNLSKFFQEVDVIIFDLPHSKLVQVLRNLDSSNRKAIFVLGSSDSYKEIIDLVRLGITKYIKKPFDISTLVKYIHEVNTQNYQVKKNFAIYTRKVNDILIVVVLGHLSEEVIKEIEEIVKNNDKVAISLNGVSSANLDLETIREFRKILDLGKNIRFILVREKIKEVILESGIPENLIYPNEYLAVKSFN